MGCASRQRATWPNWASASLASSRSRGTAPTRWPNITRRAPTCAAPTKKPSRSGTTRSSGVRNSQLSLGQNGKRADEDNCEQIWTIMGTCALDWEMKIGKHQQYQGEHGFFGKS